MSDYDPHYGQGMVIKSRAGRPSAGEKPNKPIKSKYSAEDRIAAIADRDAEKLLAMAEEYQAVGKLDMRDLCLRYAKQFSQPPVV